MRGNPDGSLSSPGAARAAALFPVYGWALFWKVSPSDDWSGSDKIMAGVTPANPATLVAGPYARRAAAEASQQVRCPLTLSSRLKRTTTMVEVCELSASESAGSRPDRSVTGLYTRSQ